MDMTPEKRHNKQVILQMEESLVLPP